MENVEISQIRSAECGPNIRQIKFEESTHSKLFWSIIVYNLIFAILPACGNLAASAYLIRKRCLYKRRLDNLAESVKRLRANAYSYLSLMQSAPQGIYFT